MTLTSPHTLPDDLPGTPAHQAILRAFIHRFHFEPHWQHLGLFGSLARGDWASESDVDLNVVIADGALVSPVAEIERAGPALAAEGATLALVVPDGADSADALVQSLIGISVRFHQLATTSPNIVLNLRTLASRISPEAVISAGNANRASRPQPPVVSQLVDACLRDAVETAAALRRSRPWLALELLARARGQLMAVYAQTHNGQRPLQFFEAHAPPVPRAHLAACVPPFITSEIHSALNRLLRLLEYNLSDFAGAAVTLTPAQAAVLAAVKAKVA